MNNKNKMRTRLNKLAAAISLTGAMLMTGTSAQAADMNSSTPLVKGQEYMVVSNYPNQIHVLDLKSDTRLKTCKVPGAFGPGTMIMAPDSQTVYMLTNHYEDIYGINLDDCSVRFHTTFSEKNVRTKSMMGLAISNDGKELYVMQNPTQLNRDHYRVKDTYLAVYNTADGKGAKPARTFPAPRQVTVMATGKDGGLYMAGADIYKMDVKTGKYDVALPSRNWNRPLYVQPDVLNVWPIQTPSNDMTILYTTARFQDEKQDLATADWIYGYLNVDLETGETETTDFGPITEIYFTGMKSPKDPNLVYGVLNRLAKYDVKQKKLLKAAELDHSYYCIAMNHAGSKVYLGGTYDDVAIYDADSLEKIGSIKLPGGDMAAMTSQVFIR